MHHINPFLASRGHLYSVDRAFGTGTKDGDLAFCGFRGSGLRIWGLG